MRKEIIEIEKMEFYAFHGCYEAEKVVGNKFEVYLKVLYDGMKGAESDNVNDTVNYLDLYSIVKEQMNIPSNILENVAGRIIKSIKEKFDNIEEINVKISKLNPPLGGQVGMVSVTIIS